VGVSGSGTASETLMPCIQTFDLPFHSFIAKMLAGPTRNPSPRNTLFSRSIDEYTIDVKQETVRFPALARKLLSGYARRENGGRLQRVLELSQRRLPAPSITRAIERYICRRHTVSPAVFVSRVPLIDRLSSKAIAPLKYK
jgi:hypothetical protein